jgi:chromosome segregation ATPase
MLDESLRFEMEALQHTGVKSEFASTGNGRLPDIETHANRLWKLVNALRSITDRACDVDSRVSGRAHDFALLAIAALREAECADVIEESMETELTSLCGELKQKDETLQARETALVRLEETAKAKLAELESRIQNQENQLNDREMERQKLSSERDHLMNRLNQAELAAKQAESEAHQFKQRLEAKFSALRLQMAKPEESLVAREFDLARGEGDLKTDIENLQLRLQDAEAKLASQEEEVKQKESVIQAAAVRETEIGKLIERLSSECEKLSVDLFEKGLIISRLEGKTRHSSISGGKAWKKVLRAVICDSPRRRVLPRQIFRVVYRQFLQASSIFCPR